MSIEFWVECAALLCIAPFFIRSLMAVRGGQTLDRADRGTVGIAHPWLLVALVGTGVLVVVTVWQGWQTDFSTAAWLTLFSCLLVTVVTSKVWPLVSRLYALVGLYSCVLAVVAFASGLAAPSAAVPSPLSRLGIDTITHIVFVELMMGLLSVAAMAGLAIWIKERALKTRSRGALAASLPSIAELDHLQIRLLLLTVVVLGCGIATGILINLGDHGVPFIIDHKSLFSIAAFMSIGGLLLVYRFSGYGGRRAARFVILAYILVILAYPGVKFVSDILLDQT
ncbi:MAG: hypothetical protein AAF220_03235 [Pseudomonadota bacterium]